MKTRRALLALVLSLLAAPAALAGDPPDGPPPPKPPEPPAKKARLVVAVLDFQSSGEGAKDLAATLPDLLEPVLAESKALALVTRRELKQVQEEQKLDLAGLVASGKGAQVGNLIGAQVLVTGRVSKVDDEIVLTAKAIGAETGAFLPALVRAAATEARAALAEGLAKKVRAILEERAAELLPAPGAAAEEEKAVREKIAAMGVALPRVAVEVGEKHLSAPKEVDPAAETALLAVLPALGYPLAPAGGEREREWMSKAAAGEPTFPAPATLKTDVVVVGEGFSEYGGRVGELVSCRARLEVRAYDSKTGKILATYAGSGAGADLSERFAGKKALEALGRRAALDLGLAIAIALKAAGK